MRLLTTMALWLCLLFAPFGVLGAVSVAHGPSHHRQVELCSRYCHDHGCPHMVDRYDWSRPGPATARHIYFANIRALRSTPLSYAHANLLIYVGIAPLLAAGMLLIALWPRSLRGPVPRRELIALGIIGAPVLGLALYDGLNASQLHAWSSLYWICTDFCIHSANLLGITYEEFNFALFLVGFPLTLLTLACVVRHRVGYQGLRRRAPFHASLSAAAAGEPRRPVAPVGLQPQRSQPPL